MTVGELGRAPAVDRATDELFRADEEAEADENNDGVLATQTIDVVIVHAKLQLAHAQHRLEQPIHRVDEMYDDQDHKTSRTRSVGRIARCPSVTGLLPADDHLIKFS